MKFRALVVLVGLVSSGASVGAFAQEAGDDAIEALAARDRATRERAFDDVRVRLFDPDAFEAMVLRVERTGPEARLRLQDAVVATPASFPIVLHVAREGAPAARRLAAELLRAQLLAEWARREPAPSQKPGNDPPFEEGTQVGLEWPIGSPVEWRVALTWLEQMAPGRRGVAFHPRVRDIAGRVLDASQLARTTASGMLARWLEGSDVELVDAGLLWLLAPRAAESSSDDDGRDATRSVQRCLDALLADGV
ncbi:MAG: hypothetical protein JNL94_15925, partial [Planctomycetes bacterium]|nr:hypothetical protein [Planctomycetota bacterium]